MTCPYCGVTNHPVAECPKRLEERFGVPADYTDEDGDFAMLDSLRVECDGEDESDRTVLPFDRVVDELDDVDGGDDA